MIGGLFTGWRNQDRAVHILPLTDLHGVFTTKKGNADSLLSLPFSVKSLILLYVCLKTNLPASTTAKCGVPTTSQNVSQFTSSDTQSKVNKINGLTVPKVRVKIWFHEYGLCTGLHTGPNPGISARGAGEGRVFENLQREGQRCSK